MAEYGNPEIEYEAFQKVGKLLFSLPSPDDNRVELTVAIVGTLGLVSIFSYNENNTGQFERPNGRANSLLCTDEMWDALIELRRAHHREGLGTWFSATIELDLIGTTMSYNYEKEPDFGDAVVNSSEYVTDQELYPRNEANQPDWLKEKLSGN